MTLKRNEPQAETVNLGGLKLWRDDLVAIVNTLRECDPDAKVSAIERVADSAPTWTIEDPEQDLRDLHLQHAISRLESFTVEGKEFELAIDKNGASLKLKTPSVHLRAASSQISDRSRKRRRIPLLTKSGLIVWFIFAMATLLGWGTAGILFASLDESFSWTASWFGLPIGAMVGAAFCLSFSITNDVPSRIFTRSRSESPSFWQRKKDDVWLALIAAAIGAALGAVTTKLLS